MWRSLLRAARMGTSSSLTSSPVTSSPVTLRTLLSTRGLSSYEQPRLVDMRNGEKAPPLFSGAEHAARLARLRAYMAGAGVDAAVLTSYHNVNYFSGGFVYCHFGRLYATVVRADGDVTTVSAGIDGGHPWRRSRGHSVTYTDWQRDNFFHAVREELRDVTGTVGLEFDHVSLENKAKFDAALPNNRTVDVGHDLMRMRMIKSEEEQKVIRTGARVADLGGAACVKAAVEGAPEYEVALHATQTMVREIAAAYPDTDLMDTWTWFQSGLNTDGAHNPVTSRRLRRGDILNLNCFPMIQGYYTALERTLFLHHVTSDEHLRLWQINCDVHRRGLALIRPGAKCCDIATELNEVYRQHDLLQYRSFGYGHSFGTLCHYYGREAALELREDIDTVLEPGMVVSMEPMIMIPEGRPGAGGYREHDILIVTEDGAENITTFPYGPEHNVISQK